MTALAPWVARARDGLLAAQGHALLLHGPSGLGQYDLALALASAWLCDQPGQHGACGQCTSCHAIAVRTHADLCVLMPETEMLARAWPLPEKAQADIDDKKRRPSKEIRVEAVRDALEFSQRTDARGRGKVVLVYPAEQMNAVSANALLKTLEEPVGRVRFVLATESAAALLPTIRSRCQQHALPWPDESEALAWLQQQMEAQSGGKGADLATAQTLLRMCGQRPQDAAPFLVDAKTAQATAQTWTQFPRAMQAGHTGLVADWPARRLLDSLVKLCHDLQAQQAGAAPRFFAPESLPQSGAARRLSQWGKSLLAASRHIEHPYHPGLLTDALVAEAQAAINSRS